MSEHDIPELEDRGKPALAPLHDGCRRICRNLETNRPPFEGVDSESLKDMVFRAEVELMERDPDWVEQSHEQPDPEKMGERLIEMIIDPKGLTERQQAEYIVNGRPF